MGGDEFALANESPPIRISRDTQNNMFNKDSLFWASRDVQKGGDEFALANESSPIRISRDTPKKLFNNEFVSRVFKVTCITTHQHRGQFRVGQSRCWYRLQSSFISFSTG